jgi:peptide/nickel transport system ATP-binding protein
VTTQAQILELIRDIQRRHGTGVMFITHDFGVVAEIAERVVVMQYGKVVEQGPAAQVLKAPAHPYTKMLMASVPSLTPPERVAKIDPTVALQVRGLDKTYVSGGWFARGRTVKAAREVELTVRCTAARPWGWSANRARASPRWRAAWCGWSIRRRARC